MQKNTKEKLFIIILLTAGFFCYLNALPNSFVWDDEEQIVNNVFIKKWGNLPLTLTSSTFYSGEEKPGGGFYRPWITFSYMFNYHLWGLKPFGYHLFQIFFHLANIILIFFVLRKIFLSQGIRNSDKISFLAALLFAVHPVNVESVGYIASMGEVLYVFFGLIAMLFFLRGINYKTKNIKSSALFLTLLFAFLSLFAKESSIVILPLLFLYLLFFVKPDFKTYLKYVSGSILVVGLYLFLKFDVAKLGTKLFFVSPITQASFLERLLTVPREILSYFLIIFFPKNLYVSRHFVTTSVFDIQFWGALLILLAIVIIFVLLARKSNFLLSLFFALWFFGSIFLVLNILVPLEMTTAERWLYFPMIGVLALVSYAIFQLANNIRGLWQKRLLFGIIILAVLTLAGRTIIRLSDWKNGLTLYSHDIKLSKNSYDAENNYGVELFRVGRLDEAKLHFQKSIELQNKWYISHNNLGASYEREGNSEGALLEYQKSMELSDYYLAYENTASLLLRLDRDKEAKEFLEKAIIKFPSHSKLKLLLAFLYYKNKETPKAIEIIQSVLQIEPDNILAKNLLSNIQKGVKVY